MKKLTTLIVFASICQVLTAQVRTVVSGRILNPKNKKIQVSYWDGDDTKSITAKLDSNGRFKMVWQAKNPRSYSIEHGEETSPMFIYPGDSIQLFLNTRQFDETIKYSGDGAVVNNFLAQRLLHFEKTLESETFIQNYYRKIAFSDEDEFTAYADSVANVKLDYVNSYKDKLPASFYDYLYAEIVFDFASDKADYPSMHYYVRGIEDSTVKVKPGYYNFFDKLSFDNENYLTSNNFIGCLESYIRYKATIRFSRDSISYLDQVVVAKEVLKGKTLEMMMFQLVMRSLSYDSQGNIKSIYQLCIPEITDEDLLKIIETKYNLVSSLFPGNAAPLFTLKTKEGKSVSLVDFKGKVVYLDFWASWCGPCRMEMPSARKVQDTFTTKGIVFLYVSIDESEADWKKAMEKEKLKGVHVMAKGFNHKVPKAYAINGIPHYYLIGKDGKIIDNNASRPSDPKVYADIENALKQ